MANKLAEGVVGNQLVRYFSVNHDYAVAVGAECLTYFIDTNQAQYRITFEDGSVSDWLVCFESDDSNVIVSAEQFNEVL